MLLVLGGGGCQGAVAWLVGNGSSLGNDRLGCWGVAATLETLLHLANALLESLELVGLCLDGVLTVRI